jgi:hypothetical protein
VNASIQGHLAAVRHRNANAVRINLGTALESILDFVLKVGRLYWSLITISLVTLAMPDSLQT